MGQCFHQNGNCVDTLRTQVTPRDLGFSRSLFWVAYRRDTNLPNSQFIKTKKTASCSRLMNSEKAPKKIVQSFTDMVNMAKWLIDENQKPFVTQELGRLFLTIRGGGRRDESNEPFRVGAGE